MKYASTRSKALPLICLTVSFIISLTLFLIRNQRYIGRLPNLLKTFRNEFQVVVQILSTVLSMAQMLVLTSLVNFATRIKLFQSPTSIGSLSFWSALSIPRFDGILPPAKLLLIGLTLWLGTIFGALWAGSLTLLPVVVSRSDGQALVPLFNSTLEPTIYPAIDNGAIVLQCANNETADPRGPSYPPLDNCIVWSKLPNLIMKATTATNVTNPGQWPKIDNSTWTYKGRSYGKGSLAGLLNAVNRTIKFPDLGFSYLESGYSTQANCSRQENTVFPFQEVYNGSEPGRLSLWSSDTVILGSDNITIPPFYLASPTYNEFNSRPFGYFAWTAFALNGTHSYLATSAQPNSFSVDGPDKLLCQIEFIPMTFHVNVSKIEQSITVTPIERITDFNQTDNIAEMIIKELDLVSRMSSSSLAYTSLYVAIESNQKAAKQAYNGTDDETAWVYSLQDAIVGVADDLLTYHGILAISQSDTKKISQPMQRYFNAVRVGQPPYQIAQLVINIIMLTIYLYEAFRTKCWKQLPDFDFLNTKALILASLSPKRSSERKATRSHFRSPFGWTEDDHTKLLGFYDENSSPRLRFSDDPEERRSIISGIEQSSHLLEDLDTLSGHRSVTQDRDSTKYPRANL